MSLIPQIMNLQISPDPTFSHPWTSRNQAEEHNIPYCTIMQIPKGRFGAIGEISQPRSWCLILLSQVCRLVLRSCLIKLKILFSLFRVGERGPVLAKLW